MLQSHFLPSKLQVNGWVFAFSQKCKIYKSRWIKIKLNQGVSHLILALAVIRANCNRGVRHSSTQAKVQKICLKLINSLCLCFHTCFQDLIITFLLDCFCKTYWMITALKVSEKYYWTHLPPFCGHS